MVGARQGSPLLVGLGQDENFLDALGKEPRRVESASEASADGRVSEGAVWEALRNVYDSFIASR